ncbi:ABC transporter permease [Aneurinibacillus sp. Ricciae_BoGa-3]|uniref:ABC transporter permease n=1 Tax=Aneurinibacillus sp. Ricciae_BoGa-3 TaxID=3022697 RepID=UPI002341FE02|nr:ABC transporter permease [Aneurinibacillus sp. Ricciae_BoGa-3]WCK54324.1 ABC transporter permease [Aneurinibacillus sp. Ricciae_BoGa-3]
MLNKWNILWLLPIVIVFGFFFLYPLVMLIITSFHSGSHFTVQHYTDIVTNAYYAKALLNSLGLALIVTVVALLLSGVLAFFLARHDFPGKSIYFTLLTFPMSFPGVVVGFMIIILFGSTGIVPMLVQMLTGAKAMVFAYTILGIFLAYLYFEIPRIVMTLYGAIKEFDHSLEEAARTMGATPWQAICYVVVPTIFPIFVSAGALAFSTSMSAFGTAFTLADQFEILPIVMYNEFTLNFNIEVASAIAIVIGCICVLMNTAYRMMLERGGR